LRTYVESTCSKAGLAADIRIEHACEAMPKDTAIALFRVVQEGLSNIIRHAHAKTVTLEMTGDKHNCQLTLSDDGQGYDAASPHFHWSHGLMGMRQRAEALGGQLQIRSEVGGGTTLSVAVPLANQ